MLAVQAHFSQKLPPEEVSRFVDELASSDFWADSPEPSDSDGRGQTREMSLAEALNVESFDRAISDDTHTLIIRAEEANIASLWTDAIDRILICSTQRKHRLSIFILLRVDSADDDAIKRLLDFPNLTLIHTEPSCEAVPFAGKVTSDSVSAVASLAQMGISVPVRLSIRSRDLPYFTERCKQWSIINRGSGLIVSTQAKSIRPDHFASAILAIYEEALLPNDRLVPISGFLASLGARKTTLPVELAEQSQEPSSRGIETNECLWRGLRDHRCMRSQGGGPGWSCRVADVIYPHLLRAIATETLAGAEGAVVHPGHRLRALLHNGRLEFSSEPVSNEVQFAPDPAADPPRTIQTAKGESA